MKFRNKKIKKECQKKHHTRLHVDAAVASKYTSTFTAGTKEGAGVSLLTCPILVRNPQTKREIWINALLDSGSSTPLLSRRAAAELDLKGYAKELKIKGVAGQESKEEALVTRVEVCGKNGEKLVTCAVQVIKNPTADLKAYDWHAEKNGVDLLYGLDIVKPVNDGKVDMIIGCDTPQLLAVKDERLSSDGNVGVRDTPFGWVAFGKYGGRERRLEEGMAAAMMSYKTTVRSLDIWKPYREVQLTQSYSFRGEPERDMNRSNESESESQLRALEHGCTLSNGGGKDNALVIDALMDDSMDSYRSPTLSERALKEKGKRREEHESLEVNLCNNGADSHNVSSSCCGEEPTADCGLEAKEFEVE